MLSKTISITQLIYGTSRCKKWLDYENPHTTKTEQYSHSKKKRNTKKKYNSRKPGRRSKGHKGVSHSHKSTETVHHTPKHCKGCGSANIKITKTKSKQITDFKSMPELITTTPVSNTCIQFCFLIQADPTIPKRKGKRNHQAECVSSF